MKIGILGTGAVGSSLGLLLKEAGHSVFWGARQGGDGTLQQAASFGEVIFITLPYGVCADVLPPLASELAHKIVVDVTNPVKEDWSPLLLGQENSAGESIAKLVPSAQVVKAFNTIFADVMKRDKMERGDHRITAFVASDHQAAADKVGNLATAMGFSPLFVGPLSSARFLEAMAHLNIRLAVELKGGTDAAFIYSRNKQS